MLLSVCRAAAAYPVSDPIRKDTWKRIGTVEERMVNFGIVPAQVFAEREDGPIGRGEFVHYLVVALGKGEEASQRQGLPSFIDVAPGSGYSGAVAWAKERGLVEGDDAGLFQPERDLTRLEALEIAARAVEFEPRGDSFPDSILVPAVAGGVIPDETAQGIRSDGHEPATFRDALWLLDRFLYFVVVPSLGSTVYQHVYSPAAPTLELLSPEEGETILFRDPFVAKIQVAAPHLLPAVLRVEFDLLAEEFPIIVEGMSSRLSSHPSHGGGKERTVDVFVRDLAGRASAPVRRTYRLEWPVIRTSEEAVDFGEQPVGTASPIHTVRVTNEGPVRALVWGEVAFGKFELHHQSCSSDHDLLPEESCEIDLRFVPDRPGPHHDWLDIRVDRAIHLIPLEGVGVASGGEGGRNGSGGEGGGNGSGGEGGRNGSGGEGGGAGVGAGGEGGSPAEDGPVGMRWPDSSCSGCALGGPASEGLWLLLSLALLAMRRRARARR